jgi:Fe-S-cluster containining protein
MPVVSSPIPDLPPDLAGKRPIGGAQRFRFGCTPAVPCFTRCCADVNIVLTPVDVLHLTRRLGLTTTEFLARHALVPLTKELQLPVVMLRMEEGEGRRCPFVGPGGCTVYEDRPWSCRMYPVAMALPPARAGFEPQPLYFLLEDAFCRGGEAGRSWTVEEWRRDQDVERHEELEGGFRDIVCHPWFIGGRKLDPKRCEIFFTACYDLDRFRSFVFESTFLGRFELEADTIESLRSDDEALLRFAFRWLRFALFAEPTLTVRPAGRKTA